MKYIIRSLKYFCYLILLLVLIILALVFFICRLEDRRRRAGRVVLAFCLLAAFVLFIAFFPYISGVTASKAWLDSMKWFQGWLYY